MKKTLLALLTIGFVACNSATKNNDLDGTWIPVKQDFGGVAIPDSLFSKETLTINDSNYTMVAESVDKGIVRRNGDKMDIYGKDGVNAGKHFTAIWKFEKDELTICYNLAGDVYPESFDTKGKQMFFMSVFRKK